MAGFRYATDSADFKSIRTEGKIYVDKTDLVYNLVSNNKYVFLARPRRFGKSLLCTTLKAYFEGRKELFDGLKIMALEREWKKFPVFHFTMSGLKDCTIAEAKSKLEGALRNYEEIYGKREDDSTPGARLESLIRNAAAMTGENAVVIIDEYDSPIMRLMHDNEQCNAMRSLLREFYQVFKNEEANIRFVFLTGITKFSQLSIFSELNNLKQISMIDDYSGLCGITQEELDTTLRPCVEEYARHLSITTDEAYDLLKRNYDGYHFSPHGKDVYAPFSLLRALSKKSTDYYWFESGTSASLLENLKRFNKYALVLDYDGISASETEFCIPCETSKTPMPLLYQAGYLTIDSYDPLLKRYVMKIPNNEVRTGLVECLMPILLHSDESVNNSLAADMARCLFNGDLGGALLSLRSYIAQIPYDIISKEEWVRKGGYEAFYKLLIYMVFSMLNTIVETEVKSILGRADVVIKTPNDIFILELKVNKTARAALKQINDMEYAAPYESDPRRIVKCGVSISSELRNVVQWNITDGQGNKIENRDFKRSAARRKAAEAKQKK